MAKPHPREAVEQRLQVMRVELINRGALGEQLWMIRAEFAPMGVQ